MHRYRLLRILSLLAFWGLLVGCDATTKKPANLIAADKMVNILADIHLAESKVARMNLHSTDSANFVYKRLEKGIFKKYQIDTSAYNKSYVYYSSQPAELEALYQRVVEKLQKQATPKAVTTKDTAKKG